MRSGGDDLFRSGAQISAITAVSRVLGFARWTILGLTVGATYLGNTYQTANLVPNVLFELTAGGILMSVFVPTFVAELERDREGRFDVASSLANALLLASLVLVAAGVVLARPIMHGLTVAVADPEVRARQVELGAWFLRFFLPQIPLYMLRMVMSGVMQAHRRFALPAAAPIFSSLVLIATYLAFHSLGPRADLSTASGSQLYVLALGTTGAVVAYTLSQVPGVLRLGVRWRPVLALGDPGVRRAIGAGGYAMAFFGVTQAGLVATIILSNRVRGGVVAWWVGFAFFELPHALIGLPLAVSLLPSLAGRHVRGEGERFGELLSKGWRAAALLAAPAAAGLFVLARPVAEAVFGGGGRAAPELVGAVLRTLAPGLPAYALLAILVHSFFARREMRPPVLLNAIAVASQVAIAVSLTAALGARGADALGIIGAAHAAGQWAGLAGGVVLLSRRVRSWPVAADLRFAASALAHAAVMGAGVWLVLSATGGSLLSIAAAVVAGVAIYAALGVRVPELRELLRLKTR